MSDSDIAVKINQFSLKFFKELIKSSKSNVFVSPSSLSVALGLVHLGSNGNTKKEIRQVLNIDDYNDEEVNNFYKEILANFTKSNIVQVVTSILSQLDYPIQESFTNDAQQYFQAKLDQVDFQNNTENVTNQVNDWVKEKTNGKIPKLLEDKLDPDLCVLILNAIYFRGIWEKQFDPTITFPSEFYNNGVDIQMVPTMRQTDIFKIAFDEETKTKSVELPYKESTMAMLILLPEDRDGLPELENQLNLTVIDRIISELRPMRIVVNLPKFKVEYGCNVTEYIKNLGIVDLFQRGTADLSGMSNAGDPFVSEIFHKAVVEVDEVGTEAAAATAIKIMPMCLPPSIIIDHPFIFVIRDSQTQSIVFAGKVAEL